MENNTVGAKHFSPNSAAKHFSPNSAAKHFSPKEKDDKIL